MAFRRVTRAEFRADVRHHIGDQVFWSDDELHAIIRDALRDWNLLTGYWTGRVAVTAGANEPLVALPSLLTAAARVECGNRPLLYASLHQLNMARPTWRSQAASAPQTWTPIALNLIAVVPPPAVQTTLVVDGVLRTPALSSDTDYVDLSDALFAVLLDYVRHLAFFKIGGPWWEDSKGAFKTLLAEAAKFNTRVRDLQTFRLWFPPTNADAEGV
jgi:hypothetical protein